MEALQRHRYAEAAGSFRTLLDRYPLERALLDRARVYLELCEREMKRKPADPRTLEERLTAATAALNDGDDSHAERLARSVLGDEPRHDTALYLLAAVEARRGAADAALTFLKQTIAISPDAKAQARYDADFESLRALPAFQELIEAPPVGAGGRRARRGRPER
jgi:tetratricopeptide (TPR) repeat protein